MTRHPSPRLAVCASLALLGLVGGLATRRVDLLVEAAPFVLFLLVALALADGSVIDVGVRVGATRVLEDDPIEVVVTLRSSSARRRVEVALDLPPGTVAVGGVAVQAVALAAGERREVAFEVRAQRWGAHRLGAVVVRSHDRLGLYVQEQVVAATEIVRVYPRAEPLADLAAPMRTRRSSGDRVARREAGEGLELADLRPFLPGDRPRDVNWRVTARRGELWVTQRHPERATDVVLFVDTFSDAQLVAAVRAATTLADAYLATRDRVGLVGFGGVLHWLRAGSGRRQRFAVLDALLDARAAFSYVWKDVATIPPGVLVPGALVLGVSPLEDDRAITALVDLRARGFEVAVIELDPEAGLPRARGELDVVARRLWLARREHRRTRFRQFGIPVAPWRDGDPLHPTMEALWNASGARGARHRVSRPG